MKNLRLIAPIIACILQPGVEADLIVNLDFGSSGGFDFGTGDIVNAATDGSNLGAMHSFDILDSASSGEFTLGSDGLNDVSIWFSIIEGEDVYGGQLVDSRKGVTHDVTQVASGLQGSVPFNLSGSNESTTGDVHGYSVRVQFAPHVHVFADDLQVVLSSLNTRGELFESSSVVFEDAGGLPFGTATYEGFWQESPQGSTGTNTTSVNPAPYSVTGDGVWLASSTTTVDITDSQSPVAGAVSDRDDVNLVASGDGRLAPKAQVSGFTWTVLLEDVATTQNDGDMTSSRARFTSTLNGVNVVIQDSVIITVPEPGLIPGLFAVAVFGILRRNRLRNR